VVHGREDAHVDTEFCNNDGCADSIDTGDLHQLSALRLVRQQLIIDARIKL
jgi:hypothetical protein